MASVIICGAIGCQVPDEKVACGQIACDQDVTCGTLPCDWEGAPGSIVYSDNLSLTN